MNDGKRCWGEKRLKVGFPTLGDAVGFTNRLHCGGASLDCSAFLRSENKGILTRRKVIFELAGEST